MEPKTPQLSAYDLLGYLVPGLSFIALIDISAYHLHHIQIGYAQILARYQEVPWKGAIPLILLAYYLGHLVSFVSSYTIERHARWLYGHPSKLLLDQSSCKYLSKAPVMVHLLRFIIFLFMMPVAWIEVLGKIFKITARFLRPVDELVKDMITRAYVDLFSRSAIDFEKYPPAQFKNYDYERLGLHYALESAPAHLLSMKNYVVLYGFLRAMTFILILVTWVVMAHCWMQHNYKTAAVTFASAGMLTFASYAAYLKFWFRYHRESMMAITAVFLKNTKPSESSAPEGSQASMKSEA